MEKLNPAKARFVLDDLDNIIPGRLSLFDIKTIALAIRKSKLRKWTEVCNEALDQPVKPSELDFEIDLLC